MQVAACLLVLAVMYVGAGANTCSRSNWWSIFDTAGSSKCENEGDFIAGFFRNLMPNPSSNDYIYDLEEAECCTRNPPWNNSKTMVVNADWWTLFNNNNVWVTCPAGYFLNGLYRTGGFGGWLSNIEEGRCSKPAGHPASYGHCYDMDISSCFDDKNLCRCNADYYVTGLYKSSCDKLYCLDGLRCCTTVPVQEDVDSFDALKTRVMETTQMELAYLAHYLGFAWSYGCNAHFVGEDFVRNYDSWEAQRSSRCTGYRNDLRLNITYGNWSFEIKDIRYGAPLIQEMQQPELMDSGVLYNDEPTPATKTIIRSVNNSKVFTHSAYSDWRNFPNYTIQQSSSPFTYGNLFGQQGYIFNGTSSMNEAEEERTNTFSVSSSKTLLPNTAAKWYFFVVKTRTALTYTAEIVVKFSTNFNSFLRGVGSATATNYHTTYFNTSDRPNYNYTFGDASTPFYKALKQQSYGNLAPWLWNDMKMAFPEASKLINDLTNEDRYVFKIKGRFENILGAHAEFRWDDQTPVSAVDATQPVSTNGTSQAKMNVPVIVL
ncbi:uncharacterized protein LOC131943541 [Physella acuta]|uniref:uncharacterized protein LOC131943541 n=1 Tax=Physella acuta TaxID=109671 RepID=UPI0027DAEF21|nr:uncharacterized protein LOC131943541 [Physella acuta]